MRSSNLVARLGSSLRSLTLGPVSHKVSVPKAASISRSFHFFASARDESSVDIESLKRSLPKGCLKDPQIESLWTVGHYPTQPLTALQAVDGETILAQFDNLVDLDIPTIGAQDIVDSIEDSEAMYADSTLRKRRRKMNQHKLRKRRKKMRNKNRKNL